ncbi:hypothetical protein K1T71_011276 [Dendrolimus kikuchii]|uniref:Uncharacterized protein n=1 Tax=Dendrolimus kikuchii TaxID=765133 RepID=A0ACC1CNF0_9NEOP|nr:hypothetical protein K1T71_011276 [Dendrolimus kikuchii]
MILAPEECGCPLQSTGLSVVNSPICGGTLLFMVLLEGYLRGRCIIATPCENLQSEEILESKYDHIIVGAGTAGSIVAGRLSENGNNSVLLLEAGDTEPIGVRIPSFYRIFWSNKLLDWAFRTEPDNYCGDQGDEGCLWSRGKGVGGTSLLNGMMYHRGHCKDYETWVKMGAINWSCEDVQPFFDMSERNQEVGTLVSEKYHSTKGVMPVQRFRHQPRALHELLTALNETGVPIISDMNDPNTPDGFTIAQAFNENGQRYTTARAYLKPKSERPNLSVKTRAHVTKIKFIGKKAVGVEFVDESGVTRTVRAKKEIILSAGALSTPQILMLSGIGPRKELTKLNIPVIADLPVGQNLKNHVGVTMHFLLTNLTNTKQLDWNTLTEFVLTQEGPMTSTGLTQLTGLMYSSLADRRHKQPDLQYFFNGYYAECSKTGVIDEPACPRVVNISANGCLLLPLSEGNMTLRSTNPFDPPIFNAGYFTHADDMVMLRDAVRFIRKLMETKTLQKHGITLHPKTISHCGEPGDWLTEWIECLVRYHTDPQNHQLGSTAIGRVVDHELRVKGIKNLRVIDAGVMPHHVTGNPQGAIMMVAERGAHFVKIDHQ